MSLRHKNDPQQQKYPCLCCGFKTHDEETGGNFEICPVCFWQDDPLQNSDSDYEGGANTVSLKQAKENFVKYGASEQKFIENVRKPLEEEK